MISISVLYEDDFLIFIDKPSGVPSQPTLDGDRENLYTAAKEWLLKEKSHSYLGMHHRLDRDTSGVILFTKDPTCNQSIGDQFKDHTCLKTYVAVLHGKLKQKSGRLESYMAEAGKKNNLKKYASVKSGGKKAITNFKLLKQGRWHSLVELTIETGRTHQIRVHMSELGNPVVGDSLYGSPLSEFKKHKRFLLHAKSLQITHPKTEKPLKVESPIPLSFAVEEGFLE